MLKRTITSIGIIIVTAGFLALRLVDNRIFDILLLVISLISAYEFHRAVGEKTSKAQEILTYAFSVLSFVSAVFFTKWLIAVIAVFIAVNLLLVIIGDGKSLSSVAVSVLGGFYPSLFILLLHFVNVDTHYSNLILVFAVTPFADAGAYLIGSAIGGKKLCPKISPHKTVSGAIGGLLGGVIASVAVYFIFGHTIWNTGLDLAVYMVIGVLISAITEIGDLVESKIKRELGIKDSGNILPGHGGMLDRIDGLSFASIASYIIFCLIIPIL